ncbi:uncharacterized protein LOC110019379 [Phalaenopsis equestris]|uniref:uncharacterized protein LOC110019379 n=1 Tax=Phalaenopsis equestris TaxID=78828 RepID=UPI0009E6374F|nr:uncharacterized protein LOC110019379 [Phalaenopsis equestris]
MPQYPTLTIISRHPQLPVAGNSQSVVTSDMVQQMILSAFSALGLQGKGKTITFVSSPWFVDSGSTGLIDKEIVLLLVYVDDIVITRSDNQLMFQLQKCLQGSFHMKDLESLTYFLGLEVHSSPAGAFLHQHNHTKRLIALAGLQDGHSTDTLLEVNAKYQQNDDDFLSESSLYRQLVESLNYLTITRPNISFVVQQVSQFMQAPTHIYLAAVRHIIQYLKGSSHLGLFLFAQSPINLTTYSDVN